MEEEPNRNLGPQWFHGTPDSRRTDRPGVFGVHVGTRQAAKEALEARIGSRADGKDWDGSQEFGQTARNNHYDPTGNGPVYSDGTAVPPDARPSIFPVRIVGEMTNTTDTPHEDFKANGYMRGQIKRGTARRGYFYTNVGEHDGSVSAVVPSWKHLQAGGNA